MVSINSYVILFAKQTKTQSMRACMLYPIAEGANIKIDVSGEDGEDCEDLKFKIRHELIQALKEYGISSLRAFESKFKFVKVSRIELEHIVSQA